MIKLEIYIVERGKNKKIKNVEVLSILKDKQYVMDSVSLAIKNVGFIGRFFPNYSKKIMEETIITLHSLYKERLIKNLNVSKRKRVKK